MSRTPLYSGRIVNLGIETVVLPNGVEVDLEIIRHPGAAAIVPVDAHGQVTLIRQHRHAAGGTILEIPAGVLEPGEAPEACARRELAEEVQLASDEWTHLGAIHTTPGFTDERIHLYLARALRPAEGRPDPDEVLEIVTMNLDEAINATLDGRITDAKTIAGLHLAAHAAPR